MRLRIRGPGGTYKIECEPAETYAQLIARVEAACEWAADAGTLRLSLNKKAALDLDVGASIGSGGLRGGDLLYILAGDAAAVTRAPPVALPRQAAAPPRGWRPPAG